MAQAATTLVKPAGFGKRPAVWFLPGFEIFCSIRSLSATFSRECSIVTPEMHMKWSSLEQPARSVRLQPCRQFRRLLCCTPSTVRGHALIWHEALPVWVRPQLTAGMARAVMVDHIRRVAGHFAGKVYSWDVVNEVLDPGSHRRMACAIAHGCAAAALITLNRLSAQQTPPIPTLC